MSSSVVVLAAATVWIGSGFGLGAIAGDALELARPLDLAALNDVQTGVGVSVASGRPGLQVPTADAVHAGHLGRPYKYCVVRDCDCAMLNALGTVEQGASAAVDSVGMAIGGAIDPDSIQDQSFGQVQPL